MTTKSNFPKSVLTTFLIAGFFLVSNTVGAQELRLSKSEYFETQGVNILVFNNQYNGMFFDEKTAGIEMIHHGVRTATGGSVRLQNTPEQWDLVPKLVDRKLDEANNSIEVTLRYEELDYQTAGALAAASRALRGYNNELSDKSLACAGRLVEEADEAIKNSPDNDGPMRMMGRGAGIDAVLQLYITTKDKKYLDRFLEQIWTSLEPRAGMPGGGQGFFTGRALVFALKALPYMDHAYKAKLRDYVVKYKESITGIGEQNPYGVPITLGGWGGSGGVVNFALTNYYAYKAFPEIMSKEDVFSGLNYIFGCHPYSNISFVNAVGTRSKKVAYGNNRADFTTIAGGIVPGLILLKPDFLENKDDWPFFWGENEVTIGGSAEYILLGCAVNEMVRE